MLTVHINQQQWGPVTVTADYKGQSYTGFSSRYSITSGVWPGSPGTQFQHRLMNVRVDFETGRVYSDCYSADNETYSIDLTMGGTVQVEGFEQYTVEFEFGGVSYQLYNAQDESGNWVPTYDENLAYQRVKYIFYEINGQTVGGETWTDTAAPMLYFAPENGAAGQEYDISAFAEGYDLVDKNDLTYAYEVRFGGEVVAQTAKFTPANVGTYTIKVTATDKAGKSVSVEKQIDVSGVLTADMIADIPAQTYTGSAITPAVTVTGLTADQYDVAYSNNINAGTATVTVTAKAGSGYSGSAEKTFVINKAAQGTPEASAFAIDYKAETYSVGSGIEVASDAGFTAKLPATGTVTPGATYYIRYAEDANHTAGAAVEVKVIGRPAAPAAPVAEEITYNSITVTPVNGVEFTIEGGSFTGLQADTEYVVTATIPATDTSFKSTSTATFRTKTAPVAEYTVTLTQTEGVTFGGYESLTVTAGGTFSFTVTLSDGYDQSDIVVKANGTEITAGSDGVYKIENVNGNVTVTVEGVVPNPAEDNGGGCSSFVGTASAGFAVLACAAAVALFKKKQ